MYKHLSSLHLALVLALFLLTRTTPLFAGDPTPPLSWVQVAESTPWRKLLHYYRFFPMTAVHGEIDGEGFYFSPNGRRDPLAELTATIEGLKKNISVGKLKQPARCAFPERLRFVNSALNLQIPIPKLGDCAHYDDFISKMNPQGVALVFSSAYASNPGSMFGHTLLKIKTGKKSTLLDRTVSFAANVSSDDGGITFMLSGLFGGYVGQFAFLPYNEKVQEYINAESRDLWEYDLNFTPDESRRLVDHFWEIEANSWFDYYFINKNCSYQILTAMEVIKPDWDLASGWFWVVPAETVKRVAQIPGAITGIRYRPSLRKRMLQSLAFLNSQERNEFDKVAEHQLLPKDVQSANVLNTTIQFIQYHRAESPGVERKDLFALWDQSLERRSQLPAGHHIEEYQTPPEGHPEDSHGPIRAALNQGVSQWSGGDWRMYEEIHLKSAYHDLMNNDLGYHEFSEFDFPSFTLRYYPQTGSFNLEQLQFIKMVNIFPMGFLEKRGSWKVDAGLVSPKDLTCTDCLTAHLDGGWGPSVHLLSEKMIGYVLGGLSMDFGSGLVRGYRFGPQVEAGFLYNPWQSYKVRVQADLNSDLFQPYRPPGYATFGLDQSLSFNAHWEARMEGRQVVSLFANAGAATANYYDLKLSALYYF